MIVGASWPRLRPTASSMLQLCRSMRSVALCNLQADDADEEYTDNAKVNEEKERDTPSHNARRDLLLCSPTKVRLRGSYRSG